MENLDISRFTLNLTTRQLIGLFKSLVQSLLGGESLNLLFL